MALLAISLTGYTFNFVSGLSFTFSFYNWGDMKFKLIAEGLNIFVEVLSILFLWDAFRRFRAIAKGFIKIETKQIVWHMLTFLLFMIGSIILVFCVDFNPWSKPKRFYALYENIMVVVLISEIPFIGIVYRIQRIEISQQTAEA